MVSVDSEKCVGCGVCESVCPMSVFVVSNGKSSAGSAEDCIGCKNCVSACPTGAIVIE